MREHGEGWLVPAGPAAVFAVNAQERGWVDRQCAPRRPADGSAPSPASASAVDVARQGRREAADTGARAGGTAGSGSSASSERWLASMPVNAMRTAATR